MSADQVTSRQYKWAARNTGKHQAISATLFAVMEGGNCGSCSSNACNTYQWSRDDISKLVIYLLKELYSKGQCNTNNSVISGELGGLEGAVTEEGALVQSDLIKLIQLLFYLLKLRYQRCSCCGHTSPTKTYSCCTQTCHWMKFG
ncbi:hypothetical protein TSMEX_010975 [Taenia solium]|eukprot:TsM_000380400 transcript=TsM_000380400 gene=TsM_000380400